MADVKLVAKLRGMTGAPMGDCTAALEEAGGDIGKAQEILRKRGVLKAAKRAGRIAAEGVVASYVHAGGKIGVLVELNCETDFVAKTEKFQKLARDIAMHVAASAPLYVSRAEIPAQIIEKEKEFFSEVCLLDQQYIKDDGKTVEQLLNEAIAEIGEKISVRRFSRYELGEGIDRGEQADFAAEVEAQIK